MKMRSSQTAQTFLCLALLSYGYFPSKARAQQDSSATSNPAVQLGWYDEQAGKLYLARQTLAGIRTELAQCGDLASNVGTCAGAKADLSEANLKRIYDQMIKGAINPAGGEKIQNDANSLGIDLLWKSKITACINGQVDGVSVKTCVDSALGTLNTKINSLLGSIAKAEKPLKAAVANGDFTRNQPRQYTPGGLSQKSTDLRVAHQSISDSLANHDKNPATCYKEGGQGIDQLNPPDKVCMHRYFDTAFSTLQAYPEMKNVTDGLQKALQTCNTEKCYSDAVSKAEAALEKEDSDTQTQLSQVSPAPKGAAAGQATVSVSSAVPKGKLHYKDMNNEQKKAFLTARNAADKNKINHLNLQLIQLNGKSCGPAMAHMAPAGMMSNLNQINAFVRTRGPNPNVHAGPDLGNYNDDEDYDVDGAK
jgi:hypothetical protein